MYVSIDTYLERIFHTLENVVAPEVQSDYARSQVFAAMSLLGALAQQIEYQRELISEEIQVNSEIIARVCRAVEESGGACPPELKDFLRELEAGKQGDDFMSSNRLDGFFRQAIDFFYANRERMEPSARLEIDDLIRESINKICTRNLSFAVRLNFDKILESRGKGKSDGS